MQTITFECEVITPMFLAGADGTTPELRAPSIKGALRFWWRAMNGHLSLPDMKKIEGEIFGDTSQKSKVIIICEQKEFQIVEQHKMIAHKGNASKSFQTDETFKITLKLVRNVNLDGRTVFNFEQLKALFETFCYLGGLGKRSRRANGSLKITKFKEGGNEIQSYTSLIFHSTLIEKLNVLTLCHRNDNHDVFRFDSVTNGIKSYFLNPNNQIPYISEIFLKKKKGNEDIEALRKRISEATHNTKSEDNNRVIAKAENEGIRLNVERGQKVIPNDYKRFLLYGKVVGNGSPRFASPVIFSIPDTESLITILLNTLSYASTPDLSIQTTLINKL